MSSPSREDVQFSSGTDLCHAWIYRPRDFDVNRPRPALVIAHGLGAVKTMRLDVYGELFASQGYVVLVFDYRHFGQSGGQPRQLLSITKQIEDWHAAIAYTRSLQGVDSDRVGLWGTSFSGGHVIKVAAQDARIKVAISQCPFTSGLHSALVAPITHVPWLVGKAVKDLLFTSTQIPLIGNPSEVALMSTADSMDGYLSIKPDGQDIPLTASARISLSLPFYYPGYYARYVRCPIYFAICKTDSVAPPGPSLWFAKAAPKGTIKEYEWGHFSIYTGAGYEEASKDYVAFLQKNLPVDPEAQGSRL